MVTGNLSLPAHEGLNRDSLEPKATDVTITTLLDPALSPLVAALGLYLREGRSHPCVLSEDIFSPLTAEAETPAETIPNLKKVIKYWDGPRQEVGLR